MRTDRGVLVFNRSYVNAAVLEHLEMYCKAFARAGLKLTPLDSVGVVFDSSGGLRLAGADGYGFCVFWDKDILLARAMENAGIKVFNPSSAIELCDDKSKTFLALNGLNIRMPFTIKSPLLYNGEERSNDFLDYILSEIGLPMIVKECVGSMGRQVYLAQGRFELLRLRRKLITVPHLYQELIAESLGEDYRYYVAGGKVIGAVRRKNNSDFRSNIAEGGSMELTEAVPLWAETAERVSERLGLTFGCVDFLKGKDSAPILCEVNSNPFFVNYYALSGVNFAEKTAEAVAADI